jgi:WD40 repeat protein
VYVDYLSPDSQFIISGDTGGFVKVYDANSGLQVQRLSGHTSWVRAVAVSLDGQFIVSGSDDGSIRV